MFLCLAQTTRSVSGNDINFSHSYIYLRFITAPFNTYVFFATVNQMFGGSFQLPTTAEHCFVVCTMLNRLIKPGRAAEHLN